MNRILFAIIISIIAVLPSWGRFATEVVTFETIDAHQYTISVDCNINDDTIYHINVKDDGRVYRGEDAVMLLKLGDGETLALYPERRWCSQEVDSMFYNNEGEAVFIYRDEMIYYYPVDRSILEQIISNGVLKVRLEMSSETSWIEKTWKVDEWGKKLGKALMKVDEKMSPDYVPPKKKTIYDDF